MKRARYFFFSIMTMLLLSIINIQDMEQDTPKIIAISFCPRENCTDALVNQLEKSSINIECALFDLDLAEIINILNKKATVIPVSVLVDKRYSEVLNESFIIPVKRSGLMHNKFCIIDEKTIITGSMNPTRNGAYKNNNNIVIFSSLILAEKFHKAFNKIKDEQKKGKKKTDILDFVSPPSISKSKNIPIVEAFFCPIENCEQEMINVLLSAKKEVLFMTYSFTSKPIADILIQLKENGIAIHGIIEKQQAKNSVHQLLTYQDISVILDKNPAMMHHKVFVVDRKIVITGSANPTRNGFDRNDENIIIIRDTNVGTQFFREFEELWKSFSAFDNNFDEEVFEESINEEESIY